MMRLLFAAMLLVGIAGTAKADELRPGYIEFSQKDAARWMLVWKAPVRGGITPDTQPILPKGCAITGEPIRSMMPLAVVTKADVRCSSDVAGKSIGLSNLSASQTDVLVRVAPLGRPVQALRLTADAPLAMIAAKDSRFQIASTYFIIGIDHIIFGFDHLLFVVSLVLLLSGFWTIFKAVTAFTIAHSLTLVGTTLGFMGLPQRPVESVIALSILFLAVEITKKQPDAPRLSERLPWVVAFAFGSLHGFGFAGALKEIGLPESDVPTALLTFNLGVEAGQLFVVLVTAALLTALRRFAAALLPAFVRTLTYGIGSVAAYWFIERTFA
jgi:hydrogenase/urease accessory protein HupE